MGRNRSFRGIVDQKKYKLTLQQLQDAQDEPLGEAINEALIQGLHVPLEEWLSNEAYTSAWLEDLAKKLNSAQVVDPQRDGFKSNSPL